MNLLLPFILLFDSMRSFFYVTLASLGLLGAAHGEPQYGAISNDLEVIALSMQLRCLLTLL